MSNASDFIIENGVLTKYVGPGGDVTVPEGVTSIGNWAFSNCDSVTSVTVPNGVVSIGERAFGYCSSLTSVELSEGVTSIGNEVFMGCKSLTGIVIPKGVTSIGDSTFYDCGSLTSVTIPDGVTSIGNSAFSYCSSLRSIIFPSSVKAIKKAVFQSCYRLTSVTLPEGVTDIGDAAFYGCGSLTGITLPASVRTVGDDVFNRCSGLSSLTVLADIELEADTFDEKLPRGLLPQVSTLWKLMTDGALMQYVLCDEQAWNALTAANQAELFRLRQSKKLIPVYVNRITKKNANTICEALAQQLTEESTVKECTAAGIFLTTFSGVTSSEKLKALYEKLKTLKAAKKAVAAAESDAQLMSVLKKKTVSAADDPTAALLLKIGTTRSALSVMIKDFYGLAVKNLPRLHFADGSEVPEELTMYLLIAHEKVGNIDEDAFRYCESLTDITIPEGVTRIGEGAFDGCKSLADDSGLVVVNGTVYWCRRDVTNVTIPEGVTRIGEGAFDGCKSLTNITIPEGVTSIGEKAFYGCEGLADDSGLVVVNGTVYWCRRNAVKVTIPEGVTCIGEGAFSECENLTRVTIPGSVTSIGYGAFMDCESLTSIIIPEGVTRIADYAFYGCKDLTSVTCPSAAAKGLSNALPKTKQLITLHIGDITGVGAKFRPNAAVGFAEDGRSCADENGKQYCKYIKSNAVKLIGLAAEHPALLYLMLREKLISAKDLDAVTAAVQKTGNAELIAAVLNYGNSAVSEQDKEKVRQKKDQRETNVTNFIFDAEKLEVLKGKTFVVTGKLKTFVSRDELKECLTTCGAALTETLGEGVDYLITNTPDSGTAKNKRAVELGVARITEVQFNAMIGRKTEG